MNNGLKVNTVPLANWIGIMFVQGVNSSIMQITWKIPRPTLSTTKIVRDPDTTIQTLEPSAIDETRPRSRN